MSLEDNYHWNVNNQQGPEHDFAINYTHPIGNERYICNNSSNNHLANNPPQTKIQIKAWYNKHKYELIVTVLSAVNLPPRLNGQYRNPYAKIYLLPDRSNKSKRRTQAVLNSCDPHWNQSFVYPDIFTSEDLDTRVLEVTVWDFDRFGTNEFLGELTIDLASLDSRHIQYTSRCIPSSVPKYHATDDIHCWSDSDGSLPMPPLSSVSVDCWHFLTTPDGLTQTNLGQGYTIPSADNCLFDVGETPYESFHGGNIENLSNCSKNLSHSRHIGSHDEINMHAIHNKRRNWLHEPHNGHSVGNLHHYDVTSPTNNLANNFPPDKVTSSLSLRDWGRFHSHNSSSTFNGMHRPNDHRHHVFSNHQTFSDTRQEDSGHNSLPIMDRNGLEVHQRSFVPHHRKHNLMRRAERDLSRSLDISNQSFGHIDNQTRHQLNTQHKDPWRNHSNGSSERSYDDDVDRDHVMQKISTNSEYSPSVIGSLHHGPVDSISQSDETMMMKGGSVDPQQNHQGYSCNVDQFHVNGSGNSLNEITSTVGCPIDEHGGYGLHGENVHDHLRYQARFKKKTKVNRDSISFSRGTTAGELLKSNQGVSGTDESSQHSENRNISNNMMRKSSSGGSENKLSECVNDKADCIDFAPLEADIPNGGSNEGSDKTNNMANYGPISAAGQRRKVGLLGSKKSTITVHRSEEVIPKLESSSPHKSESEDKNVVKDNVNTARTEEGSGFQQSWIVNDGFQLSSNNGENQQLAEFIEGLGPGQLVGRQVLAAPSLGDVQLSLLLKGNALELEIIRARGLMYKTGSKTLPAPWAKIYLVNGKHCLSKSKSNICRKSLDPTFQQKFVFNEKYQGCVLQVTIWGDYGRVEGKKVFMGVVQIMLDDIKLSTSTPVFGWYKLFTTSSLVSVPPPSQRGGGGAAISPSKQDSTPPKCQKNTSPASTSQ